MIPTEQHDRATLGAHGEPCAQCGAPLARDQRYCLACGARRVGLSPVLTDAPLVAWSAVPPGQVAAPPVGPPPSLGGEAPEPAPAPRSRWSGDASVLAGAACLLLALLVGVLIGRAGRDQAPPRAAAPQVITVGGTAATATTTATASATATPAATASATPASKSEKKSAMAIQDIQSSSGSDYSKKSAKLPKTLKTPGKLPPKDTSGTKPGGGSDTETFK